MFKFCFKVAIGGIGLLAGTLSIWDHKDEGKALVEQNRPQVEAAKAQAKSLDYCRIPGIKDLERCKK